MHAVDQRIGIQRPWSHRHVVELVVLALVGERLPSDRKLHDFSRFTEAFLGFVHVETKLTEFAARRTTAEADVGRATAQCVLQHGDVFRHTQWVMPGQHHHHRAHVDAFRGTGEEGQQLYRIGDHRVRTDVVFDSPQRVEAQLLSQQGCFDFFRHALAICLRVQLGCLFTAFARHIAAPVFIALNEQRHATAHMQTPWET